MTITAREIKELSAPRRELPNILPRVRCDKCGKDEWAEYITPTFTTLDYVPGEYNICAECDAEME